MPRRGAPRAGALARAGDAPPAPDRADSPAGTSAHYDPAEEPAHLEGGLRLRAAQATRAGRREANEDCMGLRLPDEPLLTLKGAAAVIADGVSSAEAGRQASETCVQNFLADYFSTPEPWSVRTSAQRVLTALNRWLFSQGRHLPEARRGYITTLSILVLKSETAHLFHVGDTRIYLLRGGRMTQLTTDHRASVGSQGTVLTRAMGMDTHLEIDHRELQVEPGDLFLLTTDGVHDYILPEVLRTLTISGQSDLEDACALLVETALENGSDDNLTCQMVQIEALRAPDEVYQKLTELPFPPPLSIGAQLDGWRVEAELHASSRSHLYRVRNEHTGARCVMKTPSINLEDDEAAIDRFLIEPWIGRRIHSPHVVRVLEPQTPPSALYYLLEYIDGPTLGRWMRDHPNAEIRDVVEWIAQIGRGLLAFHRRETTHRDLKPANVMIRDGRAVIVDLGACHIAGIHEIALPISRDGVLGTARYAAPELRLGFGTHPRSDLFSLGTMAYEMLTGALPYGEAIERAGSASEIARLRYTPSYQRNPMVPVWMDAAIRRAVAVEPDRRYAELSEFLADLRKPNPEYLRTGRAPLIERDPALFWKRLALILFLLEIGTLFLWLGSRSG